MPALTWMTVPPAKSSEPRSPSQPVMTPSVQYPPYTQNPIGQYTRMIHAGTKIAHAENFMRSATAPEIRAGVMTANIPR